MFESSFVAAVQILATLAYATWALIERKRRNSSIARLERMKQLDAMIGLPRSRTRRRPRTKTPGGRIPPKDKV